MIFPLGLRRIEGQDLAFNPIFLLMCVSYLDQINFNKDITVLVFKNAILFCALLFSSLSVLASESGVKKNHAEYREAGNFIFISSLPPIDPVSGQAPKEAENQVTQVFANLNALVKKLNLDMKNIVKITVYVNDRDTIMPLVDKVMDKYFIEEPYAARTPVTTSFGNKPYVVSIDAIAYRETN